MRHKSESRACGARLSGNVCSAADTRDNIRHLNEVQFRRPIYIGGRWTFRIERWAVGPNLLRSLRRIANGGPL